MKKWFFVFVLLALGIASWYYYFSGKTNITSNSAVLVYKYGKKDIRVKLSEEESAILKKMFNHKWVGHDMPSCGFDDDISIRFDEEIFKPALDGHTTIGTKNSDLYFEISDSERKSMNEILKKYGATFPAL